MKIEVAVDLFQPPAGDNLTPVLAEASRIVNSPSCYSEKNSDMVHPHQPPPQPPLGLQRPPINPMTLSHRDECCTMAIQRLPVGYTGNQRDDGSSGYGSPDSETFETLPLHQ